MADSNIKRIVSTVLSIVLMFGTVSITPAQQVSGNGVQELAVSTQHYANIVVFVDFADTTHNHEDTLLGNCYKDDPKIIEYYEGDDEHPRALKQYMSNISYGQFEVENIIPQYNSDTNKIEPYVLSHNVAYYGNRDVEGTGVPSVGDIRLVKEISSLIANDSRFSKNAIVDYDGDGCVDNLMIVTACETGNSNSLMYGHKSTYSGTEEINSKKIGSYTVIPEGSAYYGFTESGVMIHEFLHTLGYPDLYVNTNVQGVVPVGQWDIMATVSKFLQYPLAYFRSAYTNWFNIPTVTESQKNCSIYAASSTSYETKDNQAVILRTDYSANEFFVVEYRKQGTNYDVASYDNKSYESKIYGSGLIIYRVNASLTGGNMYGPPYKVYVFRPDDVIYNGYEKADYTNLDKSFLSKESGRTSYGTHDKDAGIEQNAITYSDGTNSGIVIENVGSASGDTITFDITFADNGQEGRWITESTDTLGLTLKNLASYTDKYQNEYFISNTDDSYAGNTVVYKYSDGIWSRITDGPKANSASIAVYNNDIYVSYVDSGYHVRVDKWNGSKWQNIHYSADDSYDIALTTDDNGVYFTYADTQGNEVYAYQYDGSRLTKLSQNVCYSSGKYPSNPVITADDNGNVFVAYREAYNNNNIYVRQYNSLSDNWNTILDGSMQANKVILSNSNGSLYLLKNGTTAIDTAKSYMYKFDYSASDKEWAQVGSNSVTDKSNNNTGICVNGDNIYVANNTSDNLTFVSVLVDGKWQQLGTKVSIQDIGGFDISYNNSKIYVSYLDVDTGRVVVRSCEAVKDKEPEIPVEVPITEVQLNEKVLDMYGGDTFKLTASVLPENTTDNKKVSWSSSNAAVAAVDSNGKVTAKKAGTAVITATSSNGKTAGCTVTVKQKDTYTGLRDVNGTLTYFTNGQVDKTYTGFVSYAGNNYYVISGVVDTSYTNVTYDGKDWLYVENGKVRYDYTGIRPNENGWWRIENGKVNFDYYGVAENEFGWWRIENGKVNFNFTGVASNENGEFYIENGKVDFSKNGSYVYSGVRYNIINGWAYRA